MKTKWFGTALLAGLLLCFQNCGNVKFSNDSAGNSSAQYSSSGSSVASGLNSDTSDSDTNGEVDPPGAGQSTDLVACILVDHGKSLKLGLDDEGLLMGVNSVASSVCVTRHGCLDLVPAHFDVLGAYSRGYCAHNPNVIRLSDSDLANLLKY